MRLHRRSYTRIARYLQGRGGGPGNKQALVPWRGRAHLQRYGHRRVGRNAAERWRWRRVRSARQRQQHQNVVRKPRLLEVGDSGGVFFVWTHDALPLSPKSASPCRRATGLSFSPACFLQPPAGRFCACCVLCLTCVSFSLIVVVLRVYHAWLVVLPASIRRCLRVYDFLTPHMRGV